MEIELIKLLDIERMINSFEYMIKPLCKQHLITKTSILILAYISSHKGASAKEVGEYVGLKSNLVSMNIKHLIIKDYIVRLKDKLDKRKSQLFLLEKAEKLILQIEEIKDKVINEYFGILNSKSHEEIKKLIEVF